MPQDIVSDPYNPKKLLRNMPKILTKGRLLLARTNVYVLNECLLALDLQRSRP